MAIDTWKLNVDQTQRFMLEWLNEINETVKILLNVRLDGLYRLTIKTVSDQMAIDQAQERLNKLNTYSVKEVKPDGGKPEIDS